MKNRNNGMSRRHFLGTGIAAAAAFTLIPRHVLGGNGFIAPSDQITLGFIGTGKQARGLVGQFTSHAKVIAGCDVYAKKLELFKTITEERYEKLGSSAKGFKSYVDFRQLLENKEIDAVVIATPDHWHAIQTIEAAKAGKDVLCEKPLSHSIEEGRLMVRAMEKNKRILQVGSMQRSSTNFRLACQLALNGHIGDIIEVKVACGGPGIKYDLPTEPTPKNVDWDLWIGPAEYHGFNAILAPPVEEDVFPRWRSYREYGNGTISDWGAHMFDIAQWGLGMDHTGPVEIYPPDKDHKSLTFVYSNGIKMTHEDFGRGFGVRFIGSKGIIDISRGYFETLPGNLASHQFTDSEIKLYDSKNHYTDWLEAIRTRKQPICSVETGHRTATVCYLGAIAYELNRPLRWNPENEEFANNNEANRLRSGYLRSPWKMTV